MTVKVDSDYYSDRKGSVMSILPFFGPYYVTESARHMPLFINGQNGRFGRPNRPFLMYSYFQMSPNWLGGILGPWNPLKWALGR